MKITKAVIPCAGFGTRFLPQTKAVPKEMLPIVDTPALQLIVKEAVDSGITDILIILGKNKKCIEDHFDTAVELELLLEKAGKYEQLKEIRAISKMARIHYVRQHSMNGSGPAVLEAETFVGNEPFAVIFGDDIVYTGDGTPAIGQLMNAHYQTGTSILGVQKVPKELAVRYGVVYPGATKGRYTQMNGLIEKPSIDNVPSDLASLGRFILTPDIFDIIRTTPVHSNGEIYLTDAMNLQIKTTGVYAYEFEGRRYDTGDKFGFLEANIEYALRDEELSLKLKSYIKELAKKL